MFISLLLLLGGPLVRPADIHGIVRDSASGAPIAGARVEIAGMPGIALSATPGWQADASMQIVGSQGGVSFTLSLPIEGSFREQLATPVGVLASGAAPVAVTVTLPAATWFAGAAGTTLDPNVPAHRAQI